MQSLWRLEKPVVAGIEPGISCSWFKRSQLCYIDNVRKCLVIYLFSTRLSFCVKFFLSLSGNWTGILQRTYCARIYHVMKRMGLSCFEQQESGASPPTARNLALINASSVILLSTPVILGSVRHYVSCCSWCSPKCSGNNIKKHSSTDSFTRLLEFIGLSPGQAPIKIYSAYLTFCWNLSTLIWNIIIRCISDVMLKIF